MTQLEYQESAPVWWWKVAMHLVEAQQASTHVLEHNQSIELAFQNKLREAQAILLEIFRVKGLVSGLVEPPLVAGPPGPPIPSGPAPIPPGPPVPLGPPGPWVPQMQIEAPGVTEASQKEVSGERIQEDVHMEERTGDAKAPDSEGI